jgi:hypothetical protein
MYQLKTRKTRINEKGTYKRLKKNAMHNIGNQLVQLVHSLQRMMELSFEGWGYE